MNNSKSIIRQTIEKISNWKYRYNEPAQQDADELVGYSGDHRTQADSGVEPLTANEE